MSKAFDFSRVVAIILTSLAPSTQALAQPPHSGTARWQIDWGEQRCTLFRKIEGTKPLTLAVRMIPGRFISELMVVDPSWKKDPLSYYRDVEIILDPDSSHPLPAGALTVRVAGAGRTVMVDRLPSEFKDRFAKSTSLKLALPGKPPFVSISYEHADKAVAALMECDKGLLKSWGLDFDEASKMKKGAQWLVKPEGLFTSSDYPDGSLRKMSSGTVVVAFHIPLDGRATNCRVVGSSGDRDLDQKTCGVISQRAKFTPAIGADGNPAESDAVETVTWIVAR